MGSWDWTELANSASSVPDRQATPATQSNPNFPRTVKCYFASISTDNNSEILVLVSSLRSLAMPEQSPNCAVAGSVTNVDQTGKKRVIIYMCLVLSLSCEVGETPSQHSYIVVETAHKL